MNAPPPIPGLLIASGLVAATVSILAWWFVWRYSRVTWGRTGAGRHLMRFSIVIGLTYGMTAIFMGYGLFVMAAPFPVLLGMTLAQLLLFGWAALEMYARNVLFTEAQRRDEEAAGAVEAEVE